MKVRNMKTKVLSFFSTSLIVGSAVFAFTASAAAPGHSAHGQGTLLNPDGSRRQFSFNARQLDGFQAQGNAVLHNPAFTGANDNQRYSLQVDIRCINVIGNTAFIGGLTRRTNDPNLVDAVYFAVEDNGEPGKNVDRISRAFFFDDDPNTTGDPGACAFNQLGDFPLETIDAGNVQVR
jgi:hypothetical protein